MLVLLSKVKLYFCYFTCEKKMAGRILQFSRKFSSTRKLGASLAEPLKETAPSHSADSVKLWKRLFFYVCCPTMLVGWLSVSLKEEVKPPEFIRYSHLRIRTKKYPWRDGVKTLFHNPHMNALPDGYEQIEGHH